MGELDHSQVSGDSRTSWYKIALSWELLGWITIEGRIPCSFTNFITTPELSGPLYVSPDIYHTHITEYFLKRIRRRNGSFREHLSHALPTETIFSLLRLIRSEWLIPDSSEEFLRDTLKIIIEWLQGLGSERPSDLYDRFQGELLRYESPPQFYFEDWDLNVLPAIDSELQPMI